jgi:hypothetical protein
VERHWLSVALPPHPPLSKHIAALLGHAAPRWVVTWLGLARVDVTSFAVWGLVAASVLAPGGVRIPPQGGMALLAPDVRGLSGFVAAARRFLIRLEDRLANFGEQP